MEQILEVEEPRLKIYKTRAIWVGTFIGGPLAAGYFIAENFKAFNEPDKAKKTWLYSLGATIVIFGVLFLIPEDINIPNFVIPLAYTALASSMAEHYQGQNIATHLDTGGRAFGWGRIILVMIISLLILLSGIFTIALLFGLEDM